MRDANRKAMFAKMRRKRGKIKGVSGYLVYDDLKKSDMKDLIGLHSKKEEAFQDANIGKEGDPIYLDVYKVNVKFKKER